MRGFLEKKYKDGMSADEAIKLAVLTLLEVVESGAANIEIAVIKAGSVEYMEVRSFSCLLKHMPNSPPSNRGALNRASTLCSTRLL